MFPRVFLNENLNFPFTKGPSYEDFSKSGALSKVTSGSYSVLTEKLKNVCSIRLEVPACWTGAWMFSMYLKYKILNLRIHFSTSLSFSIH